ncbi:putative protein phosphatase 2C 76 [Chlorella vulgaris]
MLAAIWEADATAPSGAEPPSASGGSTWTLWQANTTAPGSEQASPPRGGGTPSWETGIVAVAISAGVILMVISVCLILHRHLRRERRRVMQDLRGSIGSHLAVFEAADLEAARRWHAASRLSSQQHEAAAEAAADSQQAQQQQQQHRRSPSPVVVIQPDLCVELCVRDEAADSGGGGGGSLGGSDDGGGGDKGGTGSVVLQMESDGSNAAEPYMAGGQQVAEQREAAALEGVVGRVVAAAAAAGGGGLRPSSPGDAAQLETGHQSLLLSGERASSFQTWPGLQQQEQAEQQVQQTLWGGQRAETQQGGGHCVGALPPTSSMFHTRGVGHTLPGVHCRIHDVARPSRCGQPSRLPPPPRRRTTARALCAQGSTSWLEQLRTPQQQHVRTQEQGYLRNLLPWRRKQPPQQPHLNVQQHTQLELLQLAVSSLDGSSSSSSDSGSKGGPPTLLLQLTDSPLQQQQQTEAAAEGPQEGAPHLSSSLQHTDEPPLDSSTAAVLSHWTATEGDKLTEADRREQLAVAGLADVAVVSRVGRERDCWKLYNEDQAMMVPLPPPAGPPPSHALAVPPAAGAASTPTHAAAAAAATAGALAAAAATPVVDPAAAAAALVVGVFDGHGPRGAAASRAVRAALEAAVPRLHAQHVQQAQQVPPDPSHACSAPAPAGDGTAATSGGAAAAHALLGASFHAAAAALRPRARDFCESGSTAVVCLVEPGRVTAAWCGDSRAVLGLAVDTLPTTTTTSGEDSSSSSGGSPGAEDGAGSTAGTVQQYLVHSLTRDHHPNLPSERRRIEAAGGQVLQLRRDEAGKAAGPHRICGASLDLRPRLSCSRAFGDTNATSWGLTHTPDVAGVEFMLPAATTTSPASTAAAADQPSQSSLAVTAADTTSDATAEPIAVPVAAAAAPAAPSAAASLRGCEAEEGAGGQMSGVRGERRRHVLVLGSDGLWDACSNTDAVRLALSCSSAAEAAEALCQAALRRWAAATGGVRVDDITVAVLFLHA